MAFSNWFMRNGFYGEPVEPRPGVREPPQGHPIREAFELYDRAIVETDPQARADLFRNILKIAADNVWVINVTSYPPLPVVVKNGFRNVPRKLITGGVFNTPGNGGIETFFFDEARDAPGVREKTKREMVSVSPNPNIARISGDGPDTPAGHRVGRLMKTIFLSIGALLIALLAFRHPYIGRRIVIMVPTLALISMISFTIIQLPPGDFLTSYIAQLEATGEEADMQRIEEVRELFHLNDSMVSRYLDWVGVSWFFSFQNHEKGLLQGNMGRSMETLESVNDLVGDRIVLTVLISAGTILLTWAIAIPVGIFSAVRQYSIGDYILTLVGFIGMCVPNFLLALLIMYASSRWFGIKVSGLFSPEFAAQPDWTWSKIVDLLKHIWVPIVVIGTGGTAAMIRVLRGNLLDELSKPYVVTARAKGVRPIRLLLKYPVRLAINPFISGIGTLFPQLVSGGAIVAIVLSLPTVGPMLLAAIMSEDMYLAGSMLMVLSFLGVCGVLVSDLLLLLLDPRIRFEGSNK
jgi:ABC-type dipeptide/oligopeptide/nickel transport system permease component